MKNIFYFLMGISMFLSTDVIGKERDEIKLQSIRNNNYLNLDSNYSNYKNWNNQKLSDSSWQDEYNKQQQLKKVKLKECLRRWESAEIVIKGEEYPYYILLEDGYVSLMRKSFGECKEVKSRKIGQKYTNDLLGYTYYYAVENQKLIMWRKTKDRGKISKKIITKSDIPYKFW